MIITIPLSISDKILIKENDKIDFEMPLFEVKKTKYYNLNVVDLLDIDKNKIFNYLKKFIGEKVEKGEVIAEKKGFWNKKTIKSEVEGIIINIDHQTGELIIEYNQEDRKKLILSFFKGTINKISENRLELKVKKGKSFPVKSSNDNFGGEIFYFNNELESTIIKETLVKNKIVISHSLDSLTQVKMEALGARGLVTLLKLEKETSSNFSQIKNIDDFRKIFQLKYPYCLNLKFNDTIYFYE